MVSIQRTRTHLWKPETHSPLTMQWSDEWQTPIASCVCVCLNSHPRCVVIVLMYNNAHFRTKYRCAVLTQTHLPNYWRNSMWNIVRRTFFVCVCVMFGLFGMCVAVSKCPGSDRGSKLYCALPGALPAFVAPVVWLCDVMCLCGVYRLLLNRKFLTVWLPPNHRIGRAHALIERVSIGAGSMRPRVHECMFSSRRLFSIH